MAAGLTAVAVALHLRLLYRAGPLWRDEVASINLAQMPDLAHFRGAFHLDNFPAFYFLLLRGWSGLGLAGTDFQLRLFGCLLGLIGLAVLWVVCFWINRRPPLWPLALVAVAALTFQCGDQLRPYGLSAIFLLVSFGAFWKVATNAATSVRSLAVASVAATLAVQSSYTNAIFILALGLAAAFVVLRQRGVLAASFALVPGAIAAVSLAPYLASFSIGHRWLILMPGAATFGAVFEVLRTTLQLNQFLMPWFWVALILFALVAAVLKPRSAEIVFPVLALVLATFVTLIFFRVLRWQTHPRYFFLLLVFAGLCVHALWQNFAKETWQRLAQLAAVVAIAALQIPWAYADSGVRLTNVDLIAKELTSRANPDDLIVLTGFWSGLTFNRYYHGPTKWRSLPDLADFSVYRWDRVMEEMSKPEPLLAVFQEIEKTLRSGHRVFLVGSIVMQLPQTSPEPLPPAPQSIYGWDLERYMANWQTQLGYYLEHHALHGDPVPVEVNQPVYGLEDLAIFAVSGYHE